MREVTRHVMQHDKAIADQLPDGEKQAITKSLEPIPIPTAETLKVYLYEPLHPAAGPSFLT